MVNIYKPMDFRTSPYIIFSCSYTNTDCSLSLGLQLQNYSHLSFLSMTDFYSFSKICWCGDWNMYRFVQFNGFTAIRVFRSMSKQPWTIKGCWETLWRMCWYLYSSKDPFQQKWSLFHSWSFFFFLRLVLSSNKLQQSLVTSIF